MVSSLWPPVVLGGAERYAAELGARLQDQGWEVGALTFGVEGDDVIATVRSWPYRLDEFERHSNASRAAFHTLDIYRPGVWRTFGDAVQRFMPDVVHSHSVAGLSTAVLTAPNRLGVPHVHTIHDYWLLCRRSSLVRRDGTRCVERCRSCAVLSRFREATVSRHPPDLVLAVSEAVARAHADLNWIRGRVRVVRNPVELVDEPRRRTVRRSDGVEPPITLGYLGRLTKEKGVATLVQAFAASGLDPSARLLVAGDGPLRASLEHAAVPGVEFVGWLDKAAKAAFLESMDCLVVPSEWQDPAPLVIDEARGRRIPVIGARAGGIPELISAAAEPLLFTSGDAAGLGRSLRMFVADPARFADDGSGITGWDRHLGLVTNAYDDATIRS